MRAVPNCYGAPSDYFGLMARRHFSDVMALLPATPRKDGQLKSVDGHILRACPPRVPKSWFVGCERQ